MTTRTHLARIALAATAAAGLALGAALPAWAHSQLVTSTPAEGEVLTALPDEFSVTLSENLLTDAGTSAFALRVVDDEGHYFGDGCLTIEGDTVRTDAVIGEPGSYSLEWQVVSADGHPVGGSVPFEWAPEGAFEPARGSQTAPVCADAVPNPAESPAASAIDGSSDAAMDVSDVVWIVGAVLIIAVGVTVAIIASRRKPSA